VGALACASGACRNEVGAALVAAREIPAVPRAVGQGGWEELNPGENAPPAGEDTAAVLDAARHRVLVYGGKDDGEKNRNELWALDLATKSWSEITPAGPPPPPREDHTLVLDQENDALVLFGGEDGSTTNATWSFDLRANRWSDITDASAPALEGHVSVYDPRGRRMIVFGGMREEKAHKDEKVLDDATWALDLGAGSPRRGKWAKLATTGPMPSARREHRGVYDSVRGRLIVFGGRQRSKTSFLADLWLLDLETLAWHELETSGERPEPIRQTALGYDAEANLLTVFGGEIHVEHAGGDDEFTVNQVWVLDLDTGFWSNRTPHPRPMYDHQGLFVPECGGTLIYGGSSQWPGKEHETWLLRVR
jgi:hypothetical protein